MFADGAVVHLYVVMRKLLVNLPVWGIRASQIGQASKIDCFSVTSRAAFLK
ncbi:hypothetical protein [Paenibacillus sp. sgz302251]|uniref:hypothetical protein n=1 Tax=Paenibacillus sp. sgz302251 TaxID=3414493 RepID=UPI003C7D091D